MVNGKTQPRYIDRSCKFYAQGLEFLDSSGALVVLKEGSVGAGQQAEEVVSVASEGSGYEKWEDNCLVKFNKILGLSNSGLRK